MRNALAHIGCGHAADVPSSVRTLPDGRQHTAAEGVAHIVRRALALHRRGYLNADVPGWAETIARVARQILHDLTPPERPDDPDWALDPAAAADDLIHARRLPLLATGTG